MSPRSRTSRRIAVALAAAGVGVIGSSVAFGGTASANEFLPKPFLSPIPTCQAGVYHYDIGMYNFDGLGPATFTVTVSGTNEPGGTTSYVVPSGPNGLKWVYYTVPEGVTASFHVESNGGALVPIDFTATPRADCIADPVTSVAVQCAQDGSATLVYDWVNTSYTEAHFEALRNGAALQTSDIAWSDHDQQLTVPVAEGETVDAAITVNGSNNSTLNTVVDCIDEPETTIPETIPDTIPETIPDTIPETIPDTIPETVPETIPETIPETLPTPVTAVTTPAPEQIDVLGPTIPQAPQTQIPVAESLPETGSSNGPVVAGALATLLAGLGLVKIARRAH